MNEQIELPEPYRTALAEALAFVRDRWQPLGIMAAGSVLRGEGGPTSDIDLYVIHGEAWRQRSQRRFAGVPFEIFVDPPGQIRRYFAEEHAAARPITAHMLVTGRLVQEDDAGVVAGLRREAALWLDRQPEPAPARLRWTRYLLVDLLDNARDMAEADPFTARLLLNQVVQGLIDYRFVGGGRFLPRVKAQRAELAALDPVCAMQVERFLRTAGDDPAALGFVEALAHQVLGVTEFFAWDSEPDAVEA
jgi:hypothetical protein